MVNRYFSLLGAQALALLATRRARRSSPRRATARRRERGAALFLVVLVVTILTGLGLFAAHSAARIDEAVGQQREGLQALSLAEFGARIAVGEVGNPLRAGAYVGRLLDSQSTEECRVNAAIPSASPVERTGCMKLTSTMLANRIEAEVSQEMIAPQSSAEAGSLGPPTLLTGASARQGLFVVEAYDIFQTSKPLPGAPAEGSTFKGYEVNLRVYSQLRNSSTSTGMWCPATQEEGDGVVVQELQAKVSLPQVQ